MIVDIPNFNYRYTYTVRCRYRIFPLTNTVSTGSVFLRGIWIQKWSTEWGSGRIWNTGKNKRKTKPGDDLFGKGSTQFRVAEPAPALEAYDS